ncbi:hypothetical protein [Nostoc sp.]|uniref:hypothetical protein n=1 Tax=Nostoc sp. TaxID=1180 RepID=UPI002FFD2338
MKETIKTFKITFGIMTIVSVVVFGWNFYQKQQAEAELNQACEKMNALRSEVIRRIDKGEKVSNTEVSAINQIGVIMTIKCPQ